MSRKDSQKPLDSSSKQTIHKPQPIATPIPELEQSHNPQANNAITPTSHLGRNHEPMRAKQILRLQKTAGNRHVSNRLGHSAVGSNQAVAFPAVQREVSEGELEEEPEQEPEQTPEAKLGQSIGATSPPDNPDEDNLNIQAKMAVNEPGDQYEQEADAVAAEVMRMGEDEEVISRQPILQRQLQRQGAGTPAVTPQMEEEVNSLQSGGTPLPDGEREFFENRMGADFSDVRIHNNSQANHLSNDLEARAFTVGHSIAFNEGEYQPGSQQGRELLAHELTHVVQQGAATEKEEVSRKTLPLQRLDGAEENSTKTDPTPTPEEKAAAQAAASQAEARAAEIKSTGESKIVESQGLAQTEATAGEPSRQTVVDSRAAGPVQDGAQEAWLVATMTNAQTTTLTAETQKQAAQNKAQTASQQAQAAPVPSAPSVPTFTNGLPAGGGNGAMDTATAIAQNKVQTAFEIAQNPADKAPRSTAEDPAFATVQEAASSTAEQERTHGQPQGEVDEAQAASVSPQAELDSQAQTAQIGQMEAAETPAFDAAGFKAALMERISALTPTTAEEADNFKESGHLEGVKTELAGEVGANQAASKAPLQGEIAQGPDTSAADPKDTTALVANDPGQTPAGIGADKAAPKVKGEGELEQPLSTSHQALDQQMTSANITEEQLQISNEPTFTAALESKETAQAAVASAPATYRQFEDGLINQAESTAVVAAQTQLSGMHTDRTLLLGEVNAEQQATKGEDEQKRAQVAADITNFYTTTKSKVETLLTGLDGEVNTAFDEGAKEARTVFENFVEAKMEAYKQERYGGALGWAKWGKDKLFGMPEEVNAFYSEGKQLYLDKMGAVIDHIVSLIGTRLAQAKAEIAAGKKQIQTYVDQLPTELKEIGQQSAQDVTGKFDQLDQQIKDKQTQLIDSLAQKYVENVQTLDSRINELKEANKGLVDKALEAIGGVIQTILELKKLLLEVLANAADAVTAILENPIEFVTNLLSAVKLGLQNFVENIGTHLQNGFVEWLTGTMTGAGLKVPEDLFSLEGVLDVAMQVLGLTWENFRTRAVGVFGERMVSILETAFEVFVILKDEGMAGLLKWAQDKLSSLKDQVIDGIKQMLVTEVIEAGVKWLVGLLGGPAGAFIKAVQTIYKVISWFINNAKQIASLMNAVSLAVVDIAAGNIDGAAQYIEDALANFVPTAIGFLASLMGLGDLSKKVRQIIDKIQEPINKAIDSVLNLVKNFVLKIAKMLGLDPAGGKKGAGDGDIGEPVNFAAEKESHRLWFKTEGDNAVLMVASEDPKPVQVLIGKWEAKLASISDPEKKAQAEKDLIELKRLSETTDNMGDALLKTVNGKNGVLKPGSENQISEQDKKVAESQQQMAPILMRLFNIFDCNLDKVLMEKGPRKFLDEDCGKDWNKARAFLRSGELTEAGMSLLISFRDQEVGQNSPIVQEVITQTLGFAEKKYTQMEQRFLARFKGMQGVQFKIKPQPVTFLSAGSMTLTSDIDYNLKGDATERAVVLFNQKFRTRYAAESGTYFDVNIYAKNYVPDGEHSVDELKGVEGEVIYNDSAVNSYVALLMQMTQDEWSAFKKNAVEGLEADDAGKLNELFTQGETRFQQRETEIKNQYDVEIKKEEGDSQELTTHEQTTETQVQEMKEVTDEGVQALDSLPAETLQEESVHKTDVELRAKNRLFIQKLADVRQRRLKLVELTEQLRQAKELLAQFQADGKPDPDKNAATMDKMVKSLTGRIAQDKLKLRAEINEAYLYANEVYLTKGAVTRVVVELQMKKNAPHPNARPEDIDAINDNVAGALHQLHTIENKLPLTAKPVKYVERLEFVASKLNGAVDTSGLKDQAQTLADAHNDKKEVDEGLIGSFRSGLNGVLASANRLRVKK